VLDSVDNVREANLGHRADHASARDQHPSEHAAIREALKEVNQLPNPLAIGVTLGGLLLDVLVPRPKPRAGCAVEPSLLSTRAVVRTPWDFENAAEYDDHPVASGPGVLVG
jgi:hypothetical protein